jgi:predicted nucleotidyltransferase
MDLNKIPVKYQEDIRKATNLLKKEGYKTVFLFGSMVTGKIHQDSDIDIGIKGLPPKIFFRVYAFLDKELSSTSLCNFFLRDYLFIQVFRGKVNPIVPT